VNSRFGEEDTLLSADEAADFLRASRAKLYRLVKAGELPGYKVGATYVFYLRDLHSYVRRGAQQPSADPAGRGG
jgi:excisionase family DNA binding protein